MKATKIALLSSTTLDMLVGLSKALCVELKLDLTWYVAPFNQYTQEVLNPASGSRAFEPDIVLLSVDSVTALNDPDGYLNIVCQAVEAFPTSAIFVHTLVSTTPDTLSLLEWNQADSPERRLGEINIKLSDLAIQYPSLSLIDLGRIVRLHGLQQICSPRFYYLGKIPFNKTGLQAISDQFVAAINSYLGRRKKVIVLDLDNTLWGGVLGEDGTDGLKLSNDAEGKAFYDFQRLLYKLWKTGILLVISSKNDEEMALTTIRTHPYMVLKEECFAAHRINWDNKIGNIRELADELNLGLDSFVYFDDSPQERALVRAALPMVTTPDLPKDPSEYPTFLSKLPFFETLVVNEEDRQRGLIYLQERSRRELSKSIVSIDEYYHELQVKVTVRSASEFDLPRVAQLTQRTNQFNASTKRYSRDEIVVLADSKDSLVLTCSASDRYGEYGLVGVAILKQSIEGTHVDTLLMSCRALGRGIEDAFLSSIANTIKDIGDTKFRIQYEPTEKNQMVHTFLSKLGFQPEGRILVSSVDSITRAPDWIELDFTHD